MAKPNQRDLSESDRGFIRVIDDLIAVLIEKDVIALEDLPKPAREKYEARHKLRFRMVGMDELLAEAESLDDAEEKDG